MRKVFAKYQRMRVRMKISFHAFIKNETVLELWLKKIESTIRYLINSGQLPKEKFSFKNDFSKVERIPSVPKYFMTNYLKKVVTSASHVLTVPSFSNFLARSTPSSKFLVRPVVKNANDAFIRIESVSPVDALPSKRFSIICKFSDKSPPAICSMGAELHPNFSTSQMVFSVEEFWPKPCTIFSPQELNSSMP